MATEPTTAERLRERLQEASDARDAALVTYEVAKRDLLKVQLEAAEYGAQTKIEAAFAQGPLSAELHGELVANAARDHGGASARAGAVSDITWRDVRVAIASIVRRVREAEDGRAEARGELRALVEALGLEDQPRIDAIRRARTKLEEWSGA